MIEFDDYKVKINGLQPTPVTLGGALKHEAAKEEIAELEEEYASFEKAIEEMRLSALLSGEYDGCNAILNFHAGAGGTEAQDWTQMLYRMYPPHLFSAVFMKEAEPFGVP